MAGKSGYEAVRRMRTRSPQRRGARALSRIAREREGHELARLSRQFLDHLRALQRTPKSILSYGNGLELFLRWARIRNVREPRRITHAGLCDYRDWLWRYRKADGGPLSVSSQRGRLGAVKTFFSWLCRQQVIEANPASDLELPRAGKRLPDEALSVREVEAILRVPSVDDPLGLRDRALLELLYSTGIRRAEAARLALADLNRRKRLLWVRLGKGRKDRVVPVGRRALQWLALYIEHVRPLLLVEPVEQALFLTGYGSAFNHDVLGRLVHAYVEKAAIGRSGGGCHLMRHACATHLLEGGADIRYIQELLGHAKLETTAIYAQVRIVQLQRVHARCHPAEKRCRG